MRHNPEIIFSRRIPHFSICARLFIFAISLFMLFSVSSLHAEKPGSKKKEASQKSEKTSGQSASEKEAASANSGLEDINQSWMGTIHGEKQIQENSNQNPDKNNSPDTLNQESQGAETNSSADAPVNPAEDPFLPPAEEAPSFTGTLFRFVFLMGIMIAILYLILRFMKSRTGGIMGGGGLVEVISSTHLMPGKTLQIVDIAGKLYAVGVSDHGVNLITSIEDARSSDKIRLYQSQKKDVVPAGILTELTSLIKKSDYRFWHAERKSQETLPDFKTVFRKETDSEETEEVLQQDETELTQLLSRQRRKIADLKAKKTDIP